MIYREYQVKSHQAPNSVHGSMQYYQWYQSHPAWVTATLKISQYARNHTWSADSPYISLPHATKQFGRGA